MATTTLGGAARFSPGVARRARSRGANRLASPATLPHDGSRAVAARARRARAATSTIRDVAALACCWLAAGEAAAQAPHPFAPPVTMTSFALGSAAALLDANRDGSTDVVLPGLFFGTMLTTLDEHGSPLAVNGAGPGTMSFGGPSMPVVLALAGGRLDQDALEDLVTVTSTGTVQFHRNLGSTRVDRAAFAPATLVDDFAARYPIGVPFVHYSIPVAMVADVDLDGLADVVVAGGPIDRWTGSTRPGFVNVYRGDGAGGFQAVRFALPGSPIDVELADLDGSGTHDHLVVLTETGNGGAFLHELVHLTMASSALSAAGSPFVLGPGRWTSLEIADVMGDANHDYVLGQMLPNVGTMSAQVCMYQGDGQGNPLGSSWCTPLLPPNPTAGGDFVSSVQVGDWNRDGHQDLAMLRGFVQPPGAWSPSPAVHADSEVLIALGPGLQWATFTSIPLPGHHMFASTWTSAFAVLPLVAEPDALRTIDLGRDASIDLVVPGVRTPASATPTAMVTMRNLTPPQPGDARFDRIGWPSGGVAARPARIGFDGGRPQPGNSAFACTIQNVQGGCLVGLVWGPIALPGLQTVHGFDVHVAVTQVACGVLASGALAGEGFASLALPIPASAALVGDAGCFQWNYYDHVAGVFGGTQATALWIGQ